MNAPRNWTNLISAKITISFQFKDGHMKKNFWGEIRGENGVKSNKIGWNGEEMGWNAVKRLWNFIRWGEIKVKWGEIQT